jgi:hypothetical protein
MKTTLLIVIALFMLSSTAPANPTRPVVQKDDPYAADQPAREAFLAELQTAVASGDHQTVAKLVFFPMRWNHGRTHGYIRSRKAFLASYDRIFTKKVIDAIAAQKPADLFVRDQGTMIGGGEVWFEQVNGSKNFRVITVNN